MRTEDTATCFPKTPITMKRKKEWTGNGKVGEGHYFLLQSGHRIFGHRIGGQGAIIVQ